MSFYFGQDFSGTPGIKNFSGCNFFILSLGLEDASGKSTFHYQGILENSQPKTFVLCGLDTRGDNSEDSAKLCQICLKLTIKTSEQHQWCPFLRCILSSEQNFKMNTILPILWDLVIALVFYLQYLHIYYSV